jgi:hypothetical protein
MRDSALLRLHNCWEAQGLPISIFINMIVRLKALASVQHLGELRINLILCWQSGCDAIALLESLSLPFVDVVNGSFH